MSGFFSAMQLIAEQRIAEAQKRGEFEHLPGEGKPLPEEDLSHVPEELRMAYRVLKNAGYVPEAVARHREIARLADLLADGTAEKERLVAMRRLRLLVDKMGSDRHLALLEHDTYYQKILSLLERHERQAAMSEAMRKKRSA